MNQNQLVNMMLQHWRIASASGVRVDQSGRWNQHEFMARVLEADALNNANANLPTWLRRTLRKQSRINRMLHTAAGGFLLELKRGGKNQELTEQCEGHIERAREITHAGKGPGFIKRITRDQEAFNRQIAIVLELMERLVDERWDGSKPKPSITKDVHWHLREAIHLNESNAKHPGIWRRLRRNQYMINLCLIVAIKHMPELFLP